MSASPAINIKTPKIKPVIEKHIYTEEQANKVLEYAKTHTNGIAIILMLDYGLSRSELLGLKWTDIDIDNKIIYIRRGVVDAQDNNGKMYIEIGEPKNDFRKRDIPVSEECISIIDNLNRYKTVGENKKKKTKGNQVKTEFIISNIKGQVLSPRSFVRNMYTHFMEDMHSYYLSLDPPEDIPTLNPHELRHTRASIWINSGKNLFAIANVLGHSDLKMLRKRYAHADVESTRELLDIK